MCLQNHAVKQFLNIKKYNQGLSKRKECLKICISSG